MPSITAINVFPIAAPTTGFGGDARICPHTAGIGLFEGMRNIRR